MRVPAKHILRQGPVLAAMGRTALLAVAQRLEGERGPIPTTPGPTYSEVVPPRPSDLVRDLVRWAGGDPSAYRDHLPIYMFPQWGFPLVSRTLESIPYPLTLVLNAGCSMTMRAPIPTGKPLDASARLTSIDDDGRRAILNQRLITGTADVPEALVVDFQALVPLVKGGKGKKKDKPRVPNDAREIAFWRLPDDAGLEFALLTGDFNPIHWLRPYARMSGFRNTILHGFGSLALAVEGMNRALFAGDPHRLRALEVRFTRPLVLPAAVGLYVDDEGGVWVGDAPGGPAYMAGTYTTRDSDTPEEAS
ncbi:MAG: MaoC/PaaZ C-terminal domain-containing protein [Myxococcota bacterium]